jgi:nucleoside-diphosphate-sugar epimerase
LSNSRQHSIQSFLLTGASGFLGRIIKAILSEKNQLITLGRQAGNDIQCDLSITIPEITAPLDCVIHAAGKAHVVPKNAKEAQAFFEVNEQGTLNLLKGLEKLDHLPSRFIFISSVAVYGLSEGTGVEESHPLNGRTPYARSKINAERLIGKWCRANGVNCIILRLPLVAGKNAPGNLGALTKAIERGMYFSISDNAARKSMVLASDVAYLVASVKDFRESIISRMTRIRFLWMWKNRWPKD